MRMSERRLVAYWYLYWCFFGHFYGVHAAQLSGLFCLSSSWRVPGKRVTPRSRGPTVANGRAAPRLTLKTPPLYTCAGADFSIKSLIKSLNGNTGTQHWTVVDIRSFQLTVWCAAIQRMCLFRVKIYFIKSNTNQYEHIVDWLIALNIIARLVQRIHPAAFSINRLECAAIFTWRNY